MAYESILYEKTGHIAVLTINRPAAMNAINVAAWKELGAAFEAFAADDDAWVLVLTGAGGKSFCAGADLKEVAATGGVSAARPPEGARTVAAGEATLVNQTERMKRWGFGGLVRQHSDKPVIAAVNGFALGGGAEFAIFCDLIVAAEHASFGLPEVRRGLLAAGGGLLRLPRQLPLKIAMNMILTGEPMSAQEALRWGLVNQVVPADELMPAAMALAARICEASPVAVRCSKSAVHRSLLADLSAGSMGWLVSDEEAARNRMSLDALEGPRAFAEKRKPVWQGR